MSSEVIRKIKLRRGLKANLPTLDTGEPGFVTNEGELYIGSASGNVKLTSKSEIGNLSNLTTDVKTDLVSSVNELDSQLANNAKHITTKINALTYGFKNDGVTDNSNIMDTFIANDKNNILYFPTGTYCFSRPIKIYQNMFFELEQTAELKLTATQEAFITFNEEYLSNGYSYGSYIIGGKINGDFKCNTTLGLSMHRHFTLRNCTIKNFNLKGINTRYTGSSGGEMLGFKLLILNESLKSGSYAIYDNGNDNMFSDIIIQDVETSIYTGGSQFNNVHAWISLQTVIPTSTFCELKGNNASFVNCVIDTIRYGFKNNATAYACQISNLTITFNTVIYDLTQGTNYPPIIFEGTSGTARYQVTGLYVSAPFSLTIIPVTYSNKYQSRFSGCVYDKSSALQSTSNITITNALNYNVSEEMKLKGSDITTDANNAVTNGSYTTANTWSNLPYADFGVLTVVASLDWCVQIWKPKYTPYTFIRVGNISSWDSWYTLGTLSGTTAQRPTNGLRNGVSYYDTTLAKPIWYNAGVWKDATGTTV